MGTTDATPAVLDGLDAGERSVVLDRLLADHPDLRPEAEALARETFRRRRRGCRCPRGRRDLPRHRDPAHRRAGRSVARPRLPRRARGGVGAARGGAATVPRTDRSSWQLGIHRRGPALCGRRAERARQAPGRRGSRQHVRLGPARGGRRFAGLERPTRRRGGRCAVAGSVARDRVLMYTAGCPW